MRQLAICTLSFLFTLAGCSFEAQVPRKVPVVNGWEHATHLEYIVQPGDTIYSIAWAFDKDYQELAAINRLAAPYRLKPGARLKLQATRTSTKKVSSAVKPKERLVAPTTISYSTKTAAKTVVITRRGRWQWPLRGKIKILNTEKHSSRRSLKLLGNFGDEIVAAQDGVVVYSGAGIKNFGNLIILKHSEEYLSAYAYNQRNLVTEGCKVKRGERIALMGKGRSGKAQVHFEIRRRGQPVDPLRYLPSYHDR